ncbi:hypothetical protein JCM10908_000653 [Rhodotorula pacifica]|uniref:uncharacterized protein n=1 Tax=Rhodotorula pacifica TaxID=1495444 RepID=UPI003179E527
MDQQELETYEYQLSQIKLGLAKDPNNVEMQTLKTELEDLIALTKEYLSSQAPPAGAAAGATTAAAASSASTFASTTKPASSASSSAATKAKASPAPTGAKVSYKPGDECSCRYSDGKWYPARITQISGSSDQPVYTVVFKGYDTPEVVTMNDIRPSNKWDSGAAGSGASAGAGAGGAAGEKRKAGELTKEELEKERKKKKNEKKSETLKAKTEEQAAKQKGWQAFAKKGTKKGIHIPGVKGESIFRSPAEGNPNARVGVVGAGRGMTAVAQRKRQTFQEGDEE